ncbi:MAG: TatD family hydrolase [Pseudomonadota bacterium]|nr:TatD family hydrolase [Pseudomonadota bacterium]
MFIDSHCHIDFPELSGNLDQLLENMRAAQVTHALCVSVNLTDWPRVLNLAESHSNLFASVGVHPDQSVDETEPSEQDLTGRADHPRIIAIGETGLDYYRLTGDLTWQRDRFRTHIRAARSCGKPLIIHTRAASEDTVAIMREENAGQPGGVMHCFTETWEVAKAALDLGFYISFSGIITFRNAADLREVVRQVPLNQMLIETDSPYLAPVPYRGKTNQPAYVREVAASVSQIRNVPLEVVANTTTENFFRLFSHANA